MEITKQHITFASINDMTEICLPLAQNFNITSFNYIRIYPDQGRIQLMNHGDWLEHFFAEEWYRLGIYESNPTLYQSGYILWNAFQDQQIFKDSSEYFNIDNGITIIENSAQYCEFYCFGSTRDNNQIINFYVNHLDTLKKFILYFKHNAKPILKIAEKNKLYLPNYEFISPKNQYLDNLLFYLKPENTNNLFESIYPRRSSVQSPSLSEQEKGSIKLVLSGMTGKEIAKEMGLSPKTIETYLQRAKDKLQVRTKSELILAFIKLYGAEY